MNVAAPRASEGGHWYLPSGEPVYEVAAKDGSMRPATLRDARKMGLYPGVTSIIRCAAAPGLELWKTEQAILSALTLPRIEGESNDALLARIRQDAQEQARKARERGTLIHAAIQGHYEGKSPDEEFWPYVQGVKESLAANFGEQAWISEKPCAHRIGYGTKADLHSTSVVIDFKGSDFDKDGLAKLKTWDEHAMQLAATAAALGHQSFGDVDCAIVYVSRTSPGLVKVCRIDTEDLGRGWDKFRALLNYWKADRNYYPELWKAAA